MKSLKMKLLERIKSENRYWHSGELEDYARDLGYKASNATRRCRELENAGLIKRTLNKKGCVLYYTELKEIIEKPKLEFGNRSQAYAVKYGKKV